MTLFEAFVVICLAPVGLVGWGFIGCCVLDAFEKRKRRRAFSWRHRIAR